MSFSNQAIPGRTVLKKSWLFRETKQAVIFFWGNVIGIHNLNECRKCWICRFNLWEMLFYYCDIRTDILHFHSENIFKYTLLQLQIEREKNKVLKVQYVIVLRKCFCYAVWKPLHILIAIIKLSDLHVFIFIHSVEGVGPRMYFLFIFYFRNIYKRHQR